MCVDSKQINQIIMKYQFSIPTFRDLLDPLDGARVFTKIDLRSGYHQIQINPRDAWKTAFKTKVGMAMDWI